MSQLTIEGSIKKVFPQKSGEGTNGKWRCKDFLVIYDDKYPTQAILTAWGDTIEEMENAINRRAKISFKLESKERNGNWFTSAKVWRVS